MERRLWWSPSDDMEFNIDSNCRNIVWFPEIEIIAYQKWKMISQKFDMQILGILVPVEPWCFNSSIVLVMTWLELEQIINWHRWEFKFPVGDGDCTPESCKEKNVRAKMLTHQSLQSLPGDWIYTNARRLVSVCW